VLSRHSHVFAAMAELDDADVAVRRRGAQSLVGRFNKEPPSPLVRQRLAEVALDEADAAVWEHVLAAVAAETDDATRRLIAAALGHSAWRVRAKACESLGRHGRAADTPALVAMLDDPSDLVVRTAAEAIGRCGGAGSTEALFELLRLPNEALRATAAIALTRLGRPEGTAALERLSHSRDDQVRLAVACAMGEIADRTFAPTLVRLLDDRRAVRLAALDSLANITGEDPAGADASESERVEAWRRWAAASTGASTY